jgi:hypothetical protein
LVAGAIAATASSTSATFFYLLAGLRFGGIVEYFYVKTKKRY